jgi:hypothetical protein
LTNLGHHRANKGGYVQESIIVWEDQYGQKIPEGWVVHHKNGEKGDNRPENLEAMPDKKHRRLHQALGVAVD